MEDCLYTYRSTDCHEHYFVHGYGLLFFEVFFWAIQKYGVILHR